jgi:hypothetical protein
MSFNDADDSLESKCKNGGDIKLVQTACQGSLHYCQILEHHTR